MRAGLNPARSASASECRAPQYRAGGSGNHSALPDGAASQCSVATDQGGTYPRCLRSWRQGEATDLQRDRRILRRQAVSPTAWISTTGPARRGRHRGPTDVKRQKYSAGLPHCLQHAIRPCSQKRRCRHPALALSPRQPRPSGADRSSGPPHEQGRGCRSFTVRAGRKAAQSGSACAG